MPQIEGRTHRWAALVATIFFGLVWAVANIGGNFRGWAVIFAWLEASNGDMAMDPIVAHPLILLLLAILPSAGQWWLQWFRVRGGWAWPLYLVMAADLAINTVGFYEPIMGGFSFPPVWPVFFFLATLASIPNILCQGLATQNAQLVLAARGGPAPRPAAKGRNGGRLARRPRRSNSASPPVEELHI